MGLVHSDILRETTKHCNLELVFLNLVQLMVNMGMHHEKFYKEFISAFSQAMVHSQNRI